MPSVASRTSNPADLTNPTNPSNRTPGTSGTPGTVGTDQGANESRDQFLSALKSTKATFYNLVVASAYRIDVSQKGVTFAFLPNQKNAKAQCEEQKAWLQSIAEKIIGKPTPVSIVVADAASAAAPAPASPAAPAGSAAPAGDLEAEAMANSTVQAVLEIFPVDKTTIEER